jgi:hypothetical protein
MKTMTTTKISFYQSPAKLRTYDRPLKWTISGLTDRTPTLIREAYHKLLEAGCEPMAARIAIMSVANAVDTHRLKGEMT